MDDRIDEVLRAALASRPRPEVKETFTAEVLTAVAERERPAERRARFGGRLLLAGYWLAAGVAGVSLLRTLGWPPWVATALWGLALALVPLACAAFLWPHRLHACAVLCLHPLLGEARAQASSK
jgi:hypothetical protein